MLLSIPKSYSRLKKIYSHDIYQALSTVYICNKCEMGIIISPNEIKGYTINDSKWAQLSSNINLKYSYCTVSDKEYRFRKLLG